MADYVTIKRSDTEAAINKFEGTDGWASGFADEIRALLDKAPSVEPVAKMAANISTLTKRIDVLEDLLSSAYNIAARNGENTHWIRFQGQLHINGITPVTAKTFKVLPSDGYFPSPPQVAENPNPLTSTMLDYIKGEEEFDTTTLESDHIYVKHFKSLVQMRRDEVKELQAKIAELEKGSTIATKQWHEWREEAFRLNDRLKKYENGNLMLLNDGEAMEKTNE